jgi:hypothetical protein
VLSFFLTVFPGAGRDARCSNLPKLSRNWQLVAIAGAARFALGIALFVLCGASWIVAMQTQTSTPVGALVIGLPFGFGAAAIAGLFVNSRRRKQTRLFRAALNNMTRGCACSIAPRAWCCAIESISTCITCGPNMRGRERRCAIY